MPPSVFMADTAAHTCTATLLFVTLMSTELSFNRLVMTTVTSESVSRSGSSNATWPSMSAQIRCYLPLIILPPYNALSEI